MNNIAKNIKRFIELSETSYSDMSRATNTSYATLMRIIKEKKPGMKAVIPRPATIEALARYTGTTPRELIYGEPFKNRTKENPPLPQTQPFRETPTATPPTPTSIDVKQFSNLLIQALAEMKKLDGDAEKTAHLAQDLKKYVPEELPESKAWEGRDFVIASRVSGKEDVYRLITGMSLGVNVKIPSWLLPKAQGTVVVFPNKDPYSGPTIPADAWVAIDISRKPDSGDYVLAFEETVNLQTLVLRRYQKIGDTELLLAGDREVRYCAKVLGVVIGVFTVL